MTGSLPIRIALVIVVLAASGCDRRQLETVGEAGNPVVVLLTAAHAGRADSLERLTRLIEESSGLDVETRVAASPEAALRLAGTPSWDVGLLPLLQFLFCAGEYGVQPVLQVVRSDGSDRYSGELVVRADSPFERPADLDGHRVAFVDRYSTSGFLLPAALLADDGVTPIPVFTGSHEAAMRALESGFVDAAATYRGATSSRAGLRILSETAEVPNEPIFLRSDLDPDVGRRITAAFESLAEDPAGRQVLGELADITGFHRVDSTAYEPVYALVQAAGQRVADLVPSGWLIRNQNRLSPADYAP